MKQFIVKIVGLCFVCGVILGNGVITYAADEQNSIEKLQAEENKWEQLIDVIVNLKHENPNASEEQIVVMINEMTRSRSVEVRGISDIWNALTDSEKKLVIRYPFDALKVNTAKNIATNQTEIKFGRNGLGDKSDAFRHGIWNAEMTILIGIEKAELFATAHEEKDISGNETDGFTKMAHKEMDLHNNEIGRQIGQKNENLNESEMSDLIYQEVNKANSNFIWLHE